MATPNDVQNYFNRYLWDFLDKFMGKYGDYIGDADDVDNLLTSTFDEWVRDSGWFED